MNALSKIKHMVAPVCRSAVGMLMKGVKIDNKKVLFITFSGGFSCNAKYICQELLNRNENCHIVWVAGKDNSQTAEIPGNVKIVKKNTFSFFKEIASAKVIVDNGVSMIHNNYKKRKGQVLIQTWHGSLGIKRFDTNADVKWQKKMKTEASMTDILLSDSTFETELYKSTYWKNNKIIMTGHARNDILAEKDDTRRKHARQKVFDALNIPQGSKVCLYAPTFRDDNDPAPYNIDFALLKDTLEKKFGGSWVILFRYHYRSASLVKTTVLHEDFVISASKYPDIQEVMCAADVGITDYSSWICDYMLLNRPGFLYATDYDHYKNEERGFLYPLSTMPYPLATTQQQLIKNIAEFDDNGYKEKCQAFISSKGCMEDGLASKRIGDIIDSILTENCEKEGR